MLSKGSHDYSAPVSASPGRRFGVLSEGSHDYSAPVSGSPGRRFGVLSEGSPFLMVFGPCALTSLQFASEIPTVLYFYPGPQKSIVACGLAFSDAKMKPIRRRVVP